MIEGNRTSARPDFYLLEESIRLRCIVIVENDEFSHRSQPCDFQRVFNVTNVLEKSTEHQGLPILMIRFSPHHFRRDGIFCSRTLEESHNLLLKTIQSITNEQLKPGVNLVFINYDSTKGIPDIFQEKKDVNDYATIYRDCLLMNI